MQTREAALQTVFDRYMDDTKSLGSSELRSAFDDLGIRATDEEISKMISKIDQNKDKMISFEEFREFGLLLPTANAKAVFEQFARVAAVDNGENIVSRPLRLLIA